MKTQIAFSDPLNQGKYDALAEQAARLGAIRSEVWQRFGSIKGIGLTDRTIRDAWLKEGRKFPVSANAWKETLRDAMGDIKAHHEAAKVKAKRAIVRHTNDKTEQKRLYTALKSGQWTHDNYRVFTLTEGGKVWLKIPSLEKGKPLSIPLNTTYAPQGTLRLILRNGKVEVHYAVEVEQTHDCGSRTIGVDKGYSEVLTDSDGEHHGQGLGDVLTQESDRLKKKYQRRNKLKHIAKKKPWVKKHNLGRKKLDRQAKNHQAQVKTIVYTAVNAVVDKAAVVVTEDLTSPIAGKKFSKDVSRRLSAWTKGVIADAIENVSRRRGSTVAYINAAYTSQMDSRNGTLSGKRRGDQFYCSDGVVLQADVNAARNVLARLYDYEIGRWMPYQQVKSILADRTVCRPAETVQPGLQLQA